MLTFTPDLGLFLFLAASALLVVSGYQFFLAARDAQLREAYVVRSPAEIPFPYALYALQPQGNPAGTGDGGAPSDLSRSTEATLPDAPQPAPVLPTPAPPASNPAPILPGTAAWNQPQEAPTAFRHPAPGTGFHRPLGPRGGR
jgi:hypothetical protein